MEQLPAINNPKLLVTGGGARNTFLIKRLEEVLKQKGITVEVPIDDLVDFKEAIIMGLIGVLRWRKKIIHWPLLQAHREIVLAGPFG